MKTLLFVFSLAACTAVPAFAQLGPAGVPGAPGLVPEPAAPPAANQATSKAKAPAKIPAACAKSKNVEQCVAREEVRRKARIACKGKANEEYKQCVSDYMKRPKK